MPEVPHNHTTLTSIYKYCIHFQLKMMFEELGP